MSRATVDRVVKTTDVPAAAAADVRVADLLRASIAERRVACDDALFLAELRTHPENEVAKPRRRRPALDARRRRRRARYPC